jgi:hypothetical protein
MANEIVCVASRAVPLPESKAACPDPFPNDRDWHGVPGNILGFHHCRQIMRSAGGNLFISCVPIALLGFYWAMPVEMLLSFSCWVKPKLAPTKLKQIQIQMSLGLVWLPSFGAGIKEFIYDSNSYLFCCHRIGYGIYLEFRDFHLMPNLNT